MSYPRTERGGSRELYWPASASQVSSKMLLLLLLMMMTDDDAAVQNVKMFRLSNRISYDIINDDVIMVIKLCSMLTTLHIWYILNA